MKGSNYKNLVDVLDEMAINHVKTYMMVDFKPLEDSLTLFKGRQADAGKTSDLENEN